MQKSQEQGRKAYRKPTLRTIELAVDEVLGGGCKTSTTHAPGSGPCTTSGCLGDGS